VTMYTNGIIITTVNILAEIGTYLIIFFMCMRW